MFFFSSFNFFFLSFIFPASHFISLCVWYTWVFFIDFAFLYYFWLFTTYFLQHIRPTVPCSYGFYDTIFSFHSIHYTYTLLSFRYDSIEKLQCFEDIGSSTWWQWLKLLTMVKKKGKVSSKTTDDGWCGGAFFLLEAGKHESFQFVAWVC